MHSYTDQFTSIDCQSLISFKKWRLELLLFDCEKNVKTSNHASHVQP